MAGGSDIAIDARSLELLEFAEIQRRLAGRASFEGGASMARALAPSADPSEVRRRRRETEQAFLLEEHAVTAPGGAFDMRDAIGLVVRGGVLDIVGLERLDATIAVALEVRADVAAHREAAPDLADRLWLGVQPQLLGGLAAALDRTLDRRGGILDSASPELGDYRRGLVRARRDAADMLRRLAVRLGSHLQETFITERAGRPVLAVKASSRSAVPGIVHDTSASGSTLFVEPLELIEVNNRLRELEAMEAAEVERIVAEMSERISQIAGELRAMIAALAEHDLALASARLSYDWDGCTVDDGDEPQVVGARHPLLDPRRVVPIDLDLRGIRALVISGPNTGGKTVALKTLGMFAALAQCGLRVPAQRARLPVFDRILCDIGDEQSIALSLSTFSAHVRRLAEIIAAAGPGSLVLLDEIAAGTDPDEGGPLAEAILERLVGAGARVLVTTHLGSLKEWAVRFGGAENAAVAFDPTSLQPRYAIDIGNYGASHALDIAESLGLPDGIISAARAAMSPVRRQSDALIRSATQAQAQAEAELMRAHDERERAAQTRRAAERLRADLNRQLARHRERLQADRDEVRAQARAELVIARTELAKLSDEIRAARRSERRRVQATGAGADDVRARDRSLAAAAGAERRAVQALSDTQDSDGEPAAVGDAVRDSATGLRGVVIAIEGDIALVQGDRARMRVPFARLVADARAARPVSNAPTGELRPAVVAAPEQIDVRGQRVVEACAEVREAVDAAAVAGRPRLLVIHGIGTGALRAAVREELARHPLVDKVDPASPKEGGDGATYAVLEAG